MHRVILDTNEILAAGTRWLVNAPGERLTFPQKLLVAVASDHTGLFTGKIAGEYVEKLLDLGHPKPRIQVFLGWLFGVFEQVQITTRDCHPPPEDPDDAIFLLCAIDGHAEMLITEDKHLLVLQADYNPPRITNAKDAAPELGVSP